MNLLHLKQKKVCYRLLSVFALRLGLFVASWMGLYVVDYLFDLFCLQVSITPEVISKKVNRDVMTTLVKTYGESHMAKKIPAYDGRKSLYTAGPLPFESKEFVVDLNGKKPTASSK